eukprot:148456_1
MMTNAASNPGCVKKYVLPIVVLLVGAAAVYSFMLNIGNGISAPMSGGSASNDATLMSTLVDMDALDSVSTPMSVGNLSDEATSSDTDDIYLPDSKVFAEWEYKVPFDDASKTTKQGQSNGFVEMTRDEAVTQLFELIKIYKSPGMSQWGSILKFRVRKNMETQCFYEMDLWDVREQLRGIVGYYTEFQNDVFRKVDQWEQEQAAL